MIILPKGTEVLLSEKGHYNFYYPTGDKCILEEDTKATPLSWVGPRGAIAYNIICGGETKIVWKFASSNTVIT
jgi:hypothetical protein